MGYGLGYRGYGGYYGLGHYGRWYGKRSADAEPTADADATANADADADAWYGRYYGYGGYGLGYRGYGSYYGLGHYGRWYGKRSADAEPEADADTEDTMVDIVDTTGDKNLV